MSSQPDNNEIQAQPAVDAPKVETAPAENVEKKEENAPKVEGAPTECKKDKKKEKKEKAEKTEKTEGKTENKPEEKKNEEATVEDFALIDIRIGEIVECWKHPES